MFKPDVSVSYLLCRLLPYAAVEIGWVRKISFAHPVSVVTTFFTTYLSHAIPAFLGILLGFDFFHPVQNYLPVAFSGFVQDFFDMPKTEISVPFLISEPVTGHNITIPSNTVKSFTRTATILGRTPT
jgi:hypothetical protein